MRQFSQASRRLTAAKVALIAGLAAGILAGFGFTPPAVASLRSHRVDPPAKTTPTISTIPTSPSRSIRPTTPAKPIPPTTTAPVVVVVPPPARVFATGNAQLDALLTTLPPTLFEAGAHVHFGYNPLDSCCHAGGYNPGPNDVWVSAHALASTAELTYVTAHELGHSLHLHSPHGPALTAAVAGAPSVRPGSPWDVSEKVADCIAWALYPAQTAASGITYWNCPDPWRSQVRAAL